MPTKRISGDDIAPPIDSRISELETRMALLDGNGRDPQGGRIGRVESTLTWCLRLLAATLIGTWATLIVALTKKP